MADLSPTFIEPKVAGITGEQSPVEPTVSGITGSQWSLFRQIEDETRCDFDDELNNRCPDEKVPGSNFCTFHERVEEYYDEYDIWRDYPYEVDE